VTPIEVPDLVRRRALSQGASGQRWLDGLPETVDALARQWDLHVGPTLHGGTASLVLAVTDATGRECVLKIALPEAGRDDFRRRVRVHQLAAGRGCAVLLDHDLAAGAMVLERLGPNLADLDMPLDRVLLAITDTLRVFWRPIPDDGTFPSGAEKASWLADYITTTWERLGRPCDQAVVDRAVAYCDERAAAFDAARAVLVHGDAHGWNTLAAGDGTFKFVDPEGLRSEPAHDLSVPMREYNAPLLAGDTPRLVHERAELLAARCDVDPEPVWQWGFVERVSTGLVYLDVMASDNGLAYLEVAERCR
jgi:streptomycin 6-kinase